MNFLNLNRKLAQLALLQRIELADKKLIKKRKIFGRYLFSKIFSKYFINPKKISEGYTKIMVEELGILRVPLNASPQVRARERLFRSPLLWCSVTPERGSITLSAI